MNEELRTAIRHLVKLCEENHSASDSVRIVNAYIEHGPLPAPTDPGYIPFNSPCTEGVSRAEKPRVPLGQSHKKR